MIAYLLLTATLTGSASWCIGHHTARVIYRPVGATAAEEQTALDAGSSA
ncbi:hypothetical protein [Streptomyces sp. NPDC001815]